MKIEAKEKKGFLGWRIKILDLKKHEEQKRSHKLDLRERPQTFFSSVIKDKIKDYLVL